MYFGRRAAHLYGEELGEVCCAFLATRPALAPGGDKPVRHGQSPPEHKVPPCSCSPSSCPTHLQGIVEDGDARVIQAGI